jgi:hypothetical protein
VVGEQHRTVGPRQMARQVDDREPFQCRGHRRSFFLAPEFRLLCPARVRHARAFSSPSGRTDPTLAQAR